MGPKAFLGWSLAALVLLGAAVAVTLGRPELAKVDLANEPAFPALRADPNAVAKVLVESGAGRITLTRGEAGGWTLAEKAGYPVADKPLRALISSLSDMRLSRAMTRKPERYARLELEDPAIEGAKSRLLRLEGGDGATLAEVVVGKSRARFTAGSEAGTYLRRRGEDQAWLASGRLEVETDPVAWLDKDVLNLADERVRRVEVTAPDGTGYAIAREAAEADFALEPLPEGRAPQTGEINRLGAGLAFVVLEDVQPAAALARSEPAHKVVFTAFDGLQVTVEVGPAGEGTWATFAAADAGEAGEEAAEINGRVEGWAYKLPDYVATRLTMPLEQLLEKPAS